MNTLKFTAYNIRRLLTDTPAIFFTILLPIFIYLIISSMVPNAQEQFFGDGHENIANVNSYIMIGIALYAGIAGTVGASSGITVDYNSGWHRQLALTPLRVGQLFFSHTITIAIRGALPVLSVFLAGVVGGSVMSFQQWVYSFIITCVVSIPFGFYGFIWSSLMRSESSVGLATSSLVVLGFAGNIMIPLSSSLLEWGRWTPIYGPAILARFPMAQGRQILNESMTDDPLTYALINTAIWAILFIACAVILYRRGKERS